MPCKPVVSNIKPTEHWSGCRSDIKHCLCGPSRTQCIWVDWKLGEIYKKLGLIFFVVVVVWANVFCSSRWSQILHTAQDDDLEILILLLLPPRNAPTGLSTGDWTQDFMHVAKWTTNCLTLTKHREEYTWRNTLLSLCGYAEFLSIYHKVSLNKQKKLV